MKTLKFILFFFPFTLFPQGYIFFTDSPNSNYYDPSYGFNNNGSVVVLTNSKFPVDVNNKYSGLNSLRLRWKSVTGGDWGISIGKTGFVPQDFTVKDSINFRLLSFAVLDSQTIPSIYLEDTQNHKTPKQKLSGIINTIQEDYWIKFSIPLSLFIQSPGDADLTNIKTICFGQDIPDGNLHTIYLDEIRVISINDIDSIAPETPLNLSATGFETNINLTWTLNTETDLAGYRIYRSDTSDFEIVASLPGNATYFQNNTGVPPKTYTYKISAFDSSGNESDLSEGVTASTTSLPDSILLDMVQEATFKYFWDFAHPVSGLARDRFGGSNEIVTSGGSGFGVMAILVGVERGYVSREQAIERMLKILNFLTNEADRFHGAYPHWLNGTTGNVIPFSTQDNGGDLVETAFLIQGLLTARQYFNQNNTEEEQIRNLITDIWEAVEWDWYRKDNGNFLYWHWSPNYGWAMNFRLQGPNETMITYLLAIASPTHPIPASLYHSGWASSSEYLNGNSFYGIPLYVGWDYGGPLFFAHYSFLGFDPRNKKDAYTNYFFNNKNHTLINRAYCISNPGNYIGYDHDTWGLTASDGPFGYNAFQPFNDNGTIAPTAAISSMPYTPVESINALKSFYYEYGGSIWGTYGFEDAFNLSENWFATSYLAIDQGPIIIMIENYRTQLLWNNFMANPEIQPMLDAIGFVPDFTDVPDENEIPVKYELKNNYPNPFNPTTNIEFNIANYSLVTLKIFDALGKEIAVLLNEEKNPGVYKITFDGKELSSGIYFYVLNAGGKIFSKKMCLIK
ncbi:MAG TPA: glucoamylase family protein [Ignavibacteriaceae bacterium]|nr:glucoamylase family protein [Ignavibacteriaceae bacterium]